MDCTLHWAKSGRQGNLRRWLPSRKPVTPRRTSRVRRRLSEQRLTGALLDSKFHGALRISAISFLNTAPLMWDFEHGDAGRDFEIEYTIPSAWPPPWPRDQADIGIIPAFTYAQIPGLVILPNIAIAAKDRVRSILLVSKKPIEQVRTVATDTSSRTSVALLQILFTKFFGGPRELTPHPPQLEAMLAEA